MKHLIMAVFCLLASEAYAQQQHIPDLSMSPEETYRDFELMPQKSDAGTNDERYSGNSTSTASGRLSNPYDNASPSDSFMTGYCDENFKPIVPDKCTELQRQRICNEFRRLPSDAQSVLDDIIGCMQDDDMDSDCTSDDTQRMRLVKKYWNNEPVAHALMFMPDEFQSASTKCMSGGNR